MRYINVKVQRENRADFNVTVRHSRISARSTLRKIPARARAKPIYVMYISDEFASHTYQSP